MQVSDTRSNDRLGIPMEETGEAHPGGQSVADRPKHETSNSVAQIQWALPRAVDVRHSCFVLSAADRPLLLCVLFPSLKQN